VVHLSGRQFPGIHVRGDTFATLRATVVDAVRWLRHDFADPAALDELDSLITEMDVMLGFYEQVPADHGLQRPY
jgi:hypothetical protein